MTALNEWLKERRRIYGTATGGWEHDEEDGGNFWAGGGRSDFHLTPDDARSAVDAHNTLPALLSAVGKVLELHRKEHFTATMKPYCVHCRAREVEWPCPTVRAIEGAIK